MSNKDAILSGITNFIAVIVSVFVLQKFYAMYESIIISVFMMMFLNILYISSLVIHSLHQNQEVKKLADLQNNNATPIKPFQQTYQGPNPGVQNVIPQNPPQSSNPNQTNT